MSARSSTAQSASEEGSPREGASLSSTPNTTSVGSSAPAEGLQTPQINDNILPVLLPPKKARPPTLEEEIKRTLPAGFELWELTRYQMRLTTRKLETVVLKLNVPAELEPTLKEWRTALEDRYPLTQIQIRRVSVEENLFNQLRNRFRDTNIINKSARPAIQEMIHTICGTPPEVPITPRANRPPRENLLDVPFIAIDRPEVLDREDLIHGERKHDGTLVLKVAIIDVTDFIRPHSEAYRNAHRVGQNIFTRKRVISTIGAQLSQGEGSFKLGEMRPAWVFEKKISPTQGAIDTSMKVRRAWVKNHYNLNPAGPFDVKAHPEIAPNIAALADITRILERHRMSRSSVIRLESDGAASRIVAETMIQVGHMVAQWQATQLGIDAIFWTHKEPTEEDRNSWLETLRELKIPATSDDLTNDLHVRGILRTLEERGSPVARTLENNILDLHLERTTATTKLDQHGGLRVMGYAPFKPRGALGLTNQLAWDAAYTGGPPLTLSELEVRADAWNDKRWTRSEKFYKLRVLEMLDEKLELEGNLFLGQVTEIKEERTYYRTNEPERHDALGNPLPAPPPADPSSIMRVEHRSRIFHEGDSNLIDQPEAPLEEGVRVHVKQGPIYIQVDEFSKWGILQNPGATPLKPGDPIAVTLTGFSIESPKKMRFVFERTEL